ncbi:hypothetical protein BDZ94DRAFT_864325 [Collybia nuda]|uniref:Uncharacterized protein n=1 Tax=Collybia nuda TaxID=64659 RepID=A0A9P6CCR6_9AGAR|nr:hypothetical protein BDZ94DRAFT_864325 [Collybia nuda]
MGRRDIWNDIIVRKGLGLVSLVTLWLWGILFMHHLDDIVFTLKQRRNKTTDLYPPIRWPYDVWMFIGISWSGIAEAHPWHFHLVICCFHWSWILGIYRGIKLNPSYVFTCGQALSVFTSFSPILAVFDLGIIRLIKSWEITGKKGGSLFMKFKDEFRFFFTRKPNPWRGPIRTSPEPCRSFGTLWMFMIVMGLSALWGYMMNLYIKAGTEPNTPTPINSPHKKWKIFFGRLICLGLCSWELLRRSIFLVLVKTEQLLVSHGLYGVPLCHGILPMRCTIVFSVCGTCY